jgi:hypothetical protein
LTDRDPSEHPRIGDIVRSCYDSIGERHVTGVSECGVSYYRVKTNGKRFIGYCLPGVWRKWCRAHRVSVIQRGA